MTKSERERLVQALKDCFNIPGTTKEYKVTGNTTDTFKFVDQKKLSVFVVNGEEWEEGTHYEFEEDFIKIKDPYILEEPDVVALIYPETVEVFQLDGNYN